MHPILYALYWILDFYSFVMVAAIIMSLLLQFDVVNFRSPLVLQINNVLKALTDPVLKKIRRYLPPVGGFDLSPIVVFFAISVLQHTIVYYGK